MKRDVLYAIEGERSYQENKWPLHQHSVAEWILILEKLVADARREWVTGHGDNSALHEVRQIAATAVACMEQCGCPLRGQPIIKPAPPRSMSERPILFSGPMVRAILAGSKTQTRRVITPQPKHRVIQSSQNGKWYDADCINPGVEVKPRYAKGGRLWVKETFTQVHPCQIDQARFSIEVRAGIPGPPLVMYRVVYRADSGEIHPCHSIHKPPFRARGKAGNIEDELPCYKLRWSPSIFMPRWASRISLQVTEVRAERVSDISSADAIAEGIASDEWDTARVKFSLLWDSINAKRGFGWDRNPWV